MSKTTYELRLIKDRLINGKPYKANTAFGTLTLNDGVRPNHIFDAGRRGLVVPARIAPSAGTSEAAETAETSDAGGDNSGSSDPGVGGEQTGGATGGPVTEVNLNRATKDELIAAAKELGLEPDPSLTKDQLKKAIEQRAAQLQSQQKSDGD